MTRPLSPHASSDTNAANAATVVTSAVAAAGPAASPPRTYNDAIDTLNTLQTPYHVIERRKKAGIRPDADSVRDMKAYLARIGYGTGDLARLNILHVAGTKGKGSTCAFADSILSRCRVPSSSSDSDGGSGATKTLKTGLLTSPHLVAVRERIRINSLPISERLFARYFFEVYDALTLSPDSSGGPERGSAPIYARFLTLMSFHVFVREQVDVAIYETGVGGEYDATNIVPAPVATAITTLAIDHVYVLGDTVAKIAWHKAGIMKHGSSAFTVPQVPEAAAVLESRAKEKDVRLTALDVDPRLVGVGIRPEALFQRRNATLGIALAEQALQKLDPDFKPDPSKLPPEFVEGLEKVVWRGRCEIKPEGSKLLWHLDGAHTADSLKMAARWFAAECSGHGGKRVLIFNQQGREEAMGFLDGLYKYARGNDEEGENTAFHYVVFCTNVTYRTGYKRDFVNYQHDQEAINKLSLQRDFADRWRELDPKAEVSVCATIQDAIDHARNLAEAEGDGKEEAVRVFVTGSLHLVGGALGILDGTDAL